MMEQPLPYLERVKVWCELLVPIFRQLRAELGEERACEIVRSAMQDYAQDFGKSIAESGEGSSLAKLKAAMPVFTAGDTLDIEPLEDSTSELTFNVRGCKYAADFQSIGEPVLGALLTCEIDAPLTAAIGSDLELERSQTIMGGGTHCDFRWSMK